MLQHAIRIIDNGEVKLMMPETRNPFASARILGRQVDQSAYRQDVSLRGTPGYVMSRSELTEFMHCPARWKAGYVRKDTDATDWGTLMDALLLDRNNFDNRRGAGHVSLRTDQARPAHREAVEQQRHILRRVV
jgi:hypothetical protein